MLFIEKHFAQIVSNWMPTSDKQLILSGFIRICFKYLQIAFEHPVIFFSMSGWHRSQRFGHAAALGAKVGPWVDVGRPSCARALSFGQKVLMRKEWVCFYCRKQKNWLKSIIQYLTSWFGSRLQPWEDVMAGVVARRQLVWCSNCHRP